VTSQANRNTAAGLAEVSKSHPSLTERVRPKYLPLKADLARVSRTARELADVSQRDLAERLEIQRSHVARMELADEPHSVTALQVARGPREWSLAIIEWQASHHGARVEPAATDLHGSDHGARLASVTQRTCELLTTLTAALADGALNGAEPAAVRERVREACGALLELDQACLRAEREQGR
jgi:transcriptional regulator with XRE-family HTH domain